MSALPDRLADRVCRTRRARPSAWTVETHYPGQRPRHRRRWLSPLRALQLAQRTPGRAGSGSPPRTSGTGWSAASSPGRTGCGSRCQPGQCQPWTATWASTVRFASRRQADVRRTGWSGVRRKRLAKPGRPQRSQRRSFVVGQPQAPVWASQPRQAQTRERAIDHQAASSSGARWWRQERSVRSQAVALATGSWRSSLARRISPTTSG